MQNLNCQSIVVNELTVKRRINFAGQPLSLTGERLNESNSRLNSVEQAVYTGVAGPTGPAGTPGTLFYCQISMSTDFSTFSVGQSASLSLPPTPGLQYSANQTLLINCIDEGQTDYYVVCSVQSFIDNTLTFKISTIHLPTQEGQTTVGLVWEINMSGPTGLKGDTGADGQGYIQFPTTTVNNFTDCLAQLNDGGTTGPNAERYAACRFAADEFTPIGDLTTKTLVLPTFTNGSHIVINQETEGTGTFLLTVSCINNDSSTYSIQMISEPTSFRKEQGTWTSYNGF
jgi:hypothetical protein